VAHPTPSSLCSALFSECHNPDPDCKTPLSARSGLLQLFPLCFLHSAQSAVNFQTFFGATQYVNLEVPSSRLESPPLFFSNLASTAVSPPVYPTFRRIEVRNLDAQIYAFGHSRTIGFLRFRSPPTFLIAVMRCHSRCPRRLFSSTGVVRSSKTHFSPQGPIPLYSILFLLLSYPSTENSGQDS